jgi:heme exporter protein D
VNLVVFPPVLLGLAVLTVASFAKRRATLRQVPEFPDTGM